MDIEEQRRAFEAECEANRLCWFIGVEWNGERYVSRASSKPYQQAMFEIWLAAFKAGQGAAVCGQHADDCGCNDCYAKEFYKP